MKKCVLVFCLPLLLTVFQSARAQDFDGDGYPDMSVYCPWGGTWYVLKSSGGTLMQDWGFSDATPVPGDYDGDGCYEFAVYHQAAGNWYVLTTNGEMQVVQFGWAEAEPVPNDYDKDGKTDMAVYHEDAGNWYVLCSSDGTMVVTNWGFAGANAVVETMRTAASASGPLVEAALWLDDTNAVVVASVTQGDEDLTNAVVCFNGESLPLGFPIQFETPDGLDVDITLPIFYKELSGSFGNTTASLTVTNDNGIEIFVSGDVSIPSAPTLAQPTNGQVFADTDNVMMQWANTTNSCGYVCGCLDMTGTNVVDDEDDDTGSLIEYVSPGTLGLLVSGDITMPGTSLFSVEAVTGTTNIFDYSDDYDDGSFFVVASSDSAETTITITEQTPLLDDPKASQGLRIAREYNKRIQGMTFRVRDGNPQQIASAGTVSLVFRMRRYKVSVAFVQAYDVNGNVYFSWEKRRIYKRKKKTYYVNVSVSPGTTIVFGTHDASYRGGTYSY